MQQLAVEQGWCGRLQMADDAAADVSDGEEEGQAAGSKPEKATSSFLPTSAMLSPWR